MLDVPLGFHQSFKKKTHKTLIFCPPVFLASSMCMEPSTRLLIRCYMARKWQSMTCFCQLIGGSEGGEMFSQSADGLAACFGRHYCRRIVPPVAGQWDVGPAGHSTLQRAESWHSWLEGSVAPDCPYTSPEPFLGPALSLLVLALLSIGPSTVLVWPCRAAPVCLSYF